MTGKIAAAVLAAVAAVILGLEGIGVWAPPSWLLVTAIAVSAVLAAYATIASAVRERRAAQRAASARTGALVLDGVLWAIVDMLAEQAATSTPAMDRPGPDDGEPLVVDYRDLAVSVWQVRPPRTGVLRRHQTLVPLHRLRTRRRPRATSIVWRPGKGVIGLCVRDRVPKAADLDGITAALVGVDETVWAELPDDVTLGLTWAERTDALGKYHVVVAVPVFDERTADSTVLGCVALDGPPGSLAALDRPDVHVQLTTAGRILLQREVGPVA